MPSSIELSSSNRLAIRVRKKFEEFDVPQTFLIAPAAITIQTLKDMKAYPRRHAFRMREIDKARYEPNITVKKYSSKQYDNKNSVYVIGEIYYEYVKRLAAPRTSFSDKALGLIALFVLQSFLWAGYMVYLNHKDFTSRLSKDRCYIYTAHGTPTHLRIQGNEYTLENGKLKPLDELQLGAWEREILDSDGCMTIKSGQEEE